MKTTCNKCGFQIEKSDPLINERKSRHEEHHSEKAKRLGVSKNRIVGDVKWL